MVMPWDIRETHQCDKMSGIPVSPCRAPCRTAVQMILISNKAGLFVCVQYSHSGRPLARIQAGRWGFKWLLEPSGTQLINTHVSTELRSLSPGFGL